MKYLKLYENYNIRTLQDWLEENYGDLDKEDNIYFRTYIDCDSESIDSLEGIEMFKNLEDFCCSWNNLKYLNNIEYCTKLEYLSCSENNITTFENLINLNFIMIYARKNLLKNLNGLENSSNLRILSCSENKITNLKNIKNCTNLEKLYCDGNKLKNLDDIENLIDHLEVLEVEENNFKYPLPKKFIDIFSINLYSTQDIEKYKSYELQKEFLTKYPEKINDLKPFGIHEKIKEEFADIIEGHEFGFFNLR